MKLHITGSPVLTPNVVYSCPGETVTFTCSVINYGERLWWSVDYPDTSWTDVIRQRLSSTEQQSYTYKNNEEHKFLFTLESNNSLTSTAVTNITHNMDGTLVSCEDASSTDASSMIYVSNGMMFKYLIIVNYHNEYYLN